MGLGTEGSFAGTAFANVDLIPILRYESLQKNPTTFLRYSPLILKKIAIAAPSGTRFQINESSFLMPGESFELAYGLVDISKLVFNQDVDVTIAYIY